MLRPAIRDSPSPRRPLPHLLRVLLLLLLALPLLAQRPGFDIPRWALLSTFRFSGSAPIFQVVRDVDDIVTNAKKTLDFTETVERRLLERLREARVSSEDDLLEPCNFKRNFWINSVKTYFGLRGWPEPDLTCITDFHGTRFSKSESPVLSLSDLYTSVLTRAKALDDVAPQIAQAIGNWSYPTFRHSTSYERVSQSCLLDNQGGVRVNGSWYMLTGITSHNQTELLPNFQRQFLMEHLRVDDGEMQPPLRMRLPDRPPPGSEKRVPNDNTTTSIASFRGGALPSTFGTVFPEENFAIHDALDDSDLFIQQAQDATTPSNIAILVLPLVLNLVPIALVADVGTVATLAYALMSDVVTVIPLGIKGVELIIIGNQRVRGSVLRITANIDGSVSESAAYELWTAECRASSDIRPTGVVFLVLSLIFMFGGVVAEFVARSYAVKRRALHKQALKHRKLVIPGAENAFLRSRSVPRKTRSNGGAAAGGSSEASPSYFDEDAEYVMKEN